VETYVVTLDDWLAVHRSITLVNFKLDAQNSLFLYKIHLLTRILINVLYINKEFCASSWKLTKAMLWRHSQNNLYCGHGNQRVTESLSHTT
jgi:hypothetical protein